MPLPDNFNGVEHLQDTIRRVYNKEVREHFSDVPDDDINVARSSLKQACLHEDRDSLIVTVARMLLFEIPLRHAQTLQAPIFGIPVDSFESNVRYKPQIKLYFLEDPQDAEVGYSPIEGEVTIRLKNETTSTLTEANLVTYANRVKTHFATPAYRWHKGKYKYTYKDLSEGYDLRILAFSKVEAQQLITAVLQIQNDTPNWEYLTSHEPEQPTNRYPTIPGNQLILGKSRKKRRSRPVGYVRFRYASILIHGLPSPRTLIDLSGTRANPVVSVF